MNSGAKIFSDIRKYIQECINAGKEDIAYWDKGQNLFAESIADNIYDKNQKLEKLLAAEAITKDMIGKLIKTETDDSLVLIYEDILYSYLD